MEVEREKSKVLLLGLFCCSLDLGIHLSAQVL